VGSVSISTTNLSFTGNNQTSRTTTFHDSTLITLSNVPATTTLWERVRVSGFAVGNAELSWQNDNESKLALTIRSPSSLGAGTYVSNVDVEICRDAQCTSQLQGSPLRVTVTYTVTGSAWPSTLVHWSGSLFPGTELLSTDTRAPTDTLRISTSDLPPTGLFLRHTPSATGLIQAAVFGQPTFSPQVGVAFGQYAITLRPPTALGSGLFTDTMEFEACFDPACAVVVPNSRHVLLVSVRVTATEGVEFTRRLIAPGFAPSEVVWSPANQSLYVTGAVDFASGAQVVQVDPRSGVIGNRAQLALPGPRRMAVTSDASQLYMGFASSPVLQRLKLPELVPDLSIDLGNFSASTPYVVNDLETLPGQPQTVVVATSRSGSHAGVFVYDGPLRRPDHIAVSPTQAFEQARLLVPLAAPGTFVSQNFGPSFPQVNSFEQLAVDAAGIRVVSSTPSATNMFLGDKLRGAENRLYLWNGSIHNAGSGALLESLGTELTWVDVVPDLPNRRIHAWGRTATPRDYVVTFDMDTLEPLAYARVYDAPVFPPGSGRSMALWENGVALTDGLQVVVLSGPFFSTYRGEPVQ
jgi:hypothetical protein